MTLTDVRRYQLLRGGEIKAWALSGESVGEIVAELGITLDPDVLTTRTTIFNIPVVFVAPGQPEGVIV